MKSEKSYQGVKKSTRVGLLECEKSYQGVKRTQR